MMKKTKVEMLPTEKNGVILEGVHVEGYKPRLELYKEVKDHGEWLRFGKSQHLYFTTDDEIQKGDWVLSNGHPVVVTEVRGDGEFTVAGIPRFVSNIKKIVATTNPDLWGYKTTGSHGAHAPLRSTREVVGVPKIPTDFIEAYVREQGKIKEVLIEYDELNQRSADSFDLEVYTSYRLKLRSNGTVIIHRVKEKTYKYEDLTSIRNKALGYGASDVFLEWFNQNYAE